MNFHIISQSRKQNKKERKTSKLSLFNPFVGPPYGPLAYPAGHTCSLPLLGVDSSEHCYLQVVCTALSLWCESGSFFNLFSITEVGARAYGARSLLFSSIGYSVDGATGRPRVKVIFCSIYGRSVRAQGHHLVTRDHCVHRKGIQTPSQV